MPQLGFAGRYRERQRTIQTNLGSPLLETKQELKQIDNLNHVMGINFYIYTANIMFVMVCGYHIC